MNPRVWILAATPLVLSSFALAVARSSAIANDGASRNACLPAQRLASDTFRLYKLQQQVGNETFEITSAAGSRTMLVRSAWRFLGSDVELDATLQFVEHWRPTRFEISGATSTMTDVAARVEVDGNVGRVAFGDSSWERSVAGTYFTTAHYPPSAVTMALIRRWAAAGKPDRMALLPRGEVRFQRTGRDAVRCGGERVTLQRYVLDGLIWGGLNVWIDENDELIATVGPDAELDRAESIRRGFESGMSVFVAGAVQDGIARMAEIAHNIPPVHQGEFAITGVRLVDGRGGPPLEDAAVIVAGGRVTYAGSLAAASIPRDMRIIDLPGHTVLPGLWDMHGHYEQVEWAPAGLAAGVTTVREAANEFELVVALRDAIDEERALGPRILPAGVIDGGPEPLGVITTDTPEEARAAVRRYHAAGFPQIKIYRAVPPELVPVVTREAHALGMTVTGHVPRGMNALQFIAAGADQINHLGFVGRLLSDDGADTVIARLRDAGTVLEPSLSRGEQVSHPKARPFSDFEPGAAYAPLPLREALDATGQGPERAARFENGRRWAGETVTRLQRAGVHIVLGTDLVVPGHTMHRELELAVAGGMSPMEALVIATEGSARAMGLEESVGTLAAGMRADLVVVRGDPLTDISAIRQVVLVGANGKLYEPAPLWRSVGFEPPSW